MSESSPHTSVERTPIVDVLRGWALLSVVVMNYVSIYEWNTHTASAEPDAFTLKLQTLLEVLLGSKGWTLLAVLFGFGFSSLLQKREQTGASPYLFFIRRMLWLFVFAFVNTIFFGGDILNDYALMGLLLLLFHRCNTRWLFAIGAALLLLVPVVHGFIGRHHLLFAPADRDLFFDFYERGTLIDHIKANLHMRYKWMLRLSYSVVLHQVQLGCFLLGMALHRSGALVSYSIVQVRRLFVFALAGAVGFYALDQYTTAHESAWVNYFNLYYPQVLFIMVCTSSFVMLLFAWNPAIRLIKWFAAMGRLTLTNYISQNVIGFVFLILFAPNWSLWKYVMCGTVVYAVQEVLSEWWLKRAAFGPLEWLWRSLSSGRRLNWRRS